jgi:hypothetical protein
MTPLRPLALALSLLLAPTLAFGQEAAPDPAYQAYEAKDFARAAALFVAQARDADDKSGALYNAACSYALAGDEEAAFVQLQAAIDAGLDGANPASDPDLASLHDDPRWQPLLDRFAAAHPEMAALAVLLDQSKSSAHRYFAGRRAVAAGARDDPSSLFNQYYANHAQFVGEYDEASRVYGFRPSKDDPVGAGFVHAGDALPVVLAQAKGRQAVFVNESHGQGQTRAANFALLAGLRAEGFDVLAMETLGTTPPVERTATRCANTSIDDTELAARGYPLMYTGYYSLDPVYAETIREALRLGFRVVAYDTPGSIPVREQNEAENLACLFKDDPESRLVVLAGFSHIDERPDGGGIPGGWMAHRFRKLTGIDPLTVDTTTQLALRADALRFDPTLGDAPPPLAYVLRDAGGKAYGTDAFDLVLYVPAAAHRNDGAPSWLELGGRRKRVAVAADECQGKDPCLVEARRVGEVPEAVPSDRCVIGAGQAGCTLFLPPGRFAIATMDAAEAAIATREVRVD